LFFDLFSGGPDVLQKHVFSVLVLPNGFLLEIDVHITGQGISHHQRRGGQIVTSRQRVHSSFEVSITGQHGASNNIIISDGFGHGGIQLSGVTNAGHAPIAGIEEPEFLEFGLKSGVLEVRGDHLGSRGEGGLDEGGHFESFGHGVPG